MENKHKFVGQAIYLKSVLGVFMAVSSFIILQKAYNFFDFLNAPYNNKKKSWLIYINKYGKFQFNIKA